VLGQNHMRKNNKWIILSSFLCGASAFAQTMGNVTPASVTMTVTSVRLIPVSTTGSNVSVFEGSQSLTWKASDKDFSGTSVSSLTVPAGRYVGAVVGYTTDRTVLLSGAYKYQGATNTGATVTNGSYPYTTGSNAWAFSATPTTSTTSIKFTQNGGATSTYFGGITCVATAATKATVCQTGDTFVEGSVPANVTFNLLLDLYNLVQIDSDKTAIDANGGLSLNLYPYIVFGGLGAAVHLTYQTGVGTANQTQSDATLLLDPNKNFVFAYANTWLGGSSSGPPGWCNTPGSTRGSTAAPTGKVLNPWGTDLIGQYDAANGNLAFQASDGGSTSGKGGMVVLGDIRKAAGSTVAMNCYADSSASITTWDSNFLPYLGWTYTARSPLSYGSGSNLAPTIVKVADPSGLLGIPTCTGSTVSGCGSYPQ
jgi:hypothetical protein